MCSSDETYSNMQLTDLSDLSLAPPILIQQVRMCFWAINQTKKKPQMLDLLEHVAQKKEFV